MAEMLHFWWWVSCEDAVARGRTHHRRHNTTNLSPIGALLSPAGTKVVPPGGDGRRRAARAASSDRRRHRPQRALARLVLCVSILPAVDAVVVILARIVCRSVSTTCKPIEMNTPYVRKGKGWGNGERRVVPDAFRPSACSASSMTAVSRSSPSTTRPGRARALVLALLFRQLGMISCSRSI